MNNVASRNSKLRKMREFERLRDAETELREAKRRLQTFLHESNKEKEELKVSIQQLEEENAKLKDKLTGWGQWWNNEVSANVFGWQKRKSLRVAFNTTCWWRLS